MSERTSNDNRGAGRGATDFLGLPRELWCCKVISERQLEEKTEGALNRFADLLNRQPIAAGAKKKLIELVLKSLGHRFEVEDILAAHIRAAIGEAGIHWDTAHHYGDESARLHNDLVRTRSKLRRFLRGAAARPSATQRAEMCRVLDTFFDNGTTDIAELYRLMREHYPDLLRKTKSGQLIGEAHMRRLWHNHRKPTQ